MKPLAGVQHLGHRTGKRDLHRPFAKLAFAQSTRSPSDRRIARAPRAIVSVGLDRDARHFRGELGDARLGVVGAGVRPIGRVGEGRTLTTYDATHPYYAAEYDLPDRG